MFAKMTVSTTLIAATCFSLLPVFAGAETYPSRPISLVVGYPAGGSVDLVARVVGPELSKRLGQPVMVENYGGGGGTIGASKVVRSSADGYTLLLGSGSEISIAKLTNPALKYDGLRDLAPISMVGTQPMVLVGHPSVPAKNADDLVALAKAQPGKLNFASSGVGTPLHLAGEYINAQGKISLTHVPYKGAGPLIIDLTGGQVELAVMVLSSAMPHIKNGKVKAFGVTELARSPVASDIPSLNESKSLKGVDMGVWFGLFAPAKTPADILARLNKELSEVLKDPAIKAKLIENGVRPVSNSPEQFTAFIKGETDKYREIVKTAEIKD